MSDSRLINDDYRRNTSWLIGGRILKMAVNLMLGAWVARYLGAAEFGLMNYAISFSMLFLVVASLGIDNMLSLELSRNRDDTARFLGTAWVIKMVGAVVSVGAVAVLTGHFGVERRARLLILIFMAGSLFQSANVIQFFFESEVEAHYAVRAETIQTMIAALARVCLIVAGAPLEMFMFVFFAETVVYALMLVFFYRITGNCISRWRFDFGVCGLLLRRATPLAFSGIAIIIYQRIDQVMLKHYLDNDAVGYYAAALRMCTLVSFLPFLLARSFGPALVKAHGEGEEVFNMRIQVFTDLMVWSSIGGALVLSVGAVPLIWLLFGSEYAPASAVLRIVAWKGVFAAMGLATGQWIIIKHLQVFALLRTVTGCVVNVILNLYLIPRYGIMGAAAATIVSFSLASFWIHAVIPPFRPLFGMELSSLLGGAVRLWRQRGALKTGVLVT